MAANLPNPTVQLLEQQQTTNTHHLEAAESGYFLGIEEEYAVGYLLLKEDPKISPSVELLDGQKLIAVMPTIKQAQKARCGVNRIYNSSFNQDIDNWNLVVSGEESHHLGVRLSDTWNLTNGSTAFIHQNSSSSQGFADLIYQDPEEGEFLRIREFYEYQFSGYFGLHRCNGSLQVEWFDAHKNSLKIDTQFIETKLLGGADLSAYFKSINLLIAPKSAAFARLSLRKNATKKREDDSFCFLHGCFLVKCLKLLWSGVNPPSDCLGTQV
ncbi:hypothetical protein [Neosynechococcus sphagnicola]|uniref:hypothetical protein n=1 Tax=Neosynechococcus sphagnicola TaxID=1501145 RepID=UPI00056CE079|nr:hypothetical protein [Neosynechococcus sphagnicola]